MQAWGIVKRTIFYAREYKTLLLVLCYIYIAHAELLKQYFTITKRNDSMFTSLCGTAAAENRSTGLFSPIVSLAVHAPNREHMEAVPILLESRERSA
jgi:hypothetical protein